MQRIRWWHGTDVSRHENRQHRNDERSNRPKVSRSVRWSVPSPVINSMFPGAPSREDSRFTVVPVNACRGRRIRTRMRDQSYCGRIKPGAWIRECDLPTLIFLIACLTAHIAYSSRSSFIGLSIDQLDSKKMSHKQSGFPKIVVGVFFGGCFFFWQVLNPDQPDLMSSTNLGLLRPYLRSWLVM